MFLIDFILELFYGLFHVSAYVGGTLWLTLRAAVPSLVDAFSYLIDVSVHVLAPWFVHVATGFYRNIVDCTAAVLNVCVQVVRGIDAILPHLGAFLGTGVHAVVLYCVDCLSVVVFFTCFFKFSIFVVKAWVESLLQYCITAFFILVQLVVSLLFIPLYFAYGILSACFVLFESFVWNIVAILYFGISMLSDMSMWTSLLISITVGIVLMRTRLEWFLSSLQNAYRRIKLHFVSLPQTADRDNVDIYARHGEETNLGDATRNSRLCVVCLDATRNTVLFPCRHFNLCGICARTIVNERSCCPVCRHMVARTEMVFW